MKRLLPVLAIAAVAVIALFSLTSDDATRSDRRGGTDGEAGRDAVRRDVTDAGAEGDRADAALLRELIKEHGAFVTRGRVVLTRPEAPGAGVAVSMSAVIAGKTVEVKATTGADGAFVTPELPQTGSYTIALEHDHVQPFRRDGFAAPAGRELDVGDLVANRFYFVNGRVLGGGNRSIEGADVALLETAGGGSSMSFFSSSEKSDVADPIVAQAKAGADGRFQLRLTAPGIFTMRARAEGWASRYRSDVVVSAADLDMTLAMTKGHEVVGYVLDAAGRPITDTGVTLYATSMRSWSWAKEVTNTDGTGRFMFRVEPSAREYVLGVTPPNGFNLNQRFRVPMTEDLILRVPGAGVIRGRVIDASTQQPVAGAEVLISMNKGRGGMRMPDYSKAMRTDAYGAFRLEGVGPGTMAGLTVRADGFADLRLSGWMSSDPALWQKLQGTRITGEDEVVLPDVAMKPGRVLSGVVTDKRTRAPVAGAKVELWDFVMGNRSTRTAPDGTYRFSGVGDRVAMIVQQEGYAPFREAPFPGFQLEGEDTAQRDFELEAGAVVKGTVRTADGSPVARSLVRLRTAATGWRAMMQGMNVRDLWTETDEKGEYALDGVPPLKLYAQAQAAGFDTSRSKETTVKAGSTIKLDVVLQAAARIEGVVLARDGTPVDSARITVARDPGAKTEGGAQWRALAEGVYAFTDDRGRFAVPGVPVGDVLVRIEAPGFATTTARRKGVKPGQSISAMRMEMSPAYAIGGKVVDPDGKPVMNCWVRARQTSSPNGEPTTQLMGARVEDDGSFTLRNLPEGAYSIEVRIGRMGGTARFQNMTRENVSAGTKELRLQLEATPG